MDDSRRVGLRRGAAVLAAAAVLIFAGVVWAAGGDPSGYCGGG